MKNFFPVAFLLLASFILATEPAYAQVNLGSSSSATNPERSGDATTGLFSSTTGAVSISSGGTEKMRVNATGVGIGTASPSAQLTIDATVSGNNGLQVSTTAFNALATFRYSSNTGASEAALNKARGTEASPAVVQTGDSLADFTGKGYDGSAFVNSSRIGMNVDATPSTGIIPGNITFNTANTSGTLTERMRIDSSGNVGIGTTSAANPLSVNGVIESQSGGIKFPDGTTQTTAGTSTASTGMVLLATVNASAASSVSFNSTYITTAYNKYVIEFDNTYTSAQGGIPGIQLSTNNGSTWITTNYVAAAANGSGSASQGVSIVGSGGTNGSTNPGQWAGTVKISGLGGTVNTAIVMSSGGTSMGPAYIGISGYGSNSSTSAINAIQIIDISGNGDTITGNFHLYGLKGT